MTQADNNTSTETEVDTVLTETEFEKMGWPANIEGVDSGVDRVYVISSSLSDSMILETKEAQALAFRAVADVGRQRTSDATGMSPSEVDQKLRTAQRKVTDAREIVEILDDCDY